MEMEVRELSGHVGSLRLEGMRKTGCATVGAFSMITGWADSFRRGIVVAAVTVILSLARKYLPQTKQLKGDEAIDAAGIQPMVVLCMAGVGILIAGLSFFGLREANHLMAARDGLPTVTLVPDWSLWIFFPFFGSLSLAWGTTLRVWSQFAGKEAPRAYAIWSDQKSGFQATAILRWMGWLIALPVGIATLLAVPIHANFADDGISIGRYAQWSPERHAYADVREFVVIKGNLLRDGSFESQPRIVLRFADGSQWNSFSTREDRQINPELLAYLVTKLQRAPEIRETE